MSSTAVALGLDQAARFYEASIGKKIVMAVTGFILFVYVVGHLIGNLQIFIGREQINSYAEFLHSHVYALWIIRVLLLAALTLHIFSSLQLWLLKRKARPVHYIKENNPPTDYASRTMMWSGPIVAAFIVFHLLHLTTGSLDLPFRELDAYDNVVNGFQIIPVSIAYIVAIGLLCMHLYHGVWSMFQTIGVSHPHYSLLLKRTASILAVAIFIGYVSIPVSVMTGLLRS
jgi:succinate dehydrogenase / fumarate reductase cytochrome b subunit